MLLAKNSSTVRILKSFLEPTGTSKMDLNVGVVYFIEGSGIRFNFDEKISSVFVKNLNVDFNGKINSSFFVNAVLTSFENKDEISIIKNNGKLKVGDFEFTIEDEDEDETEDEVGGLIEYISFTKEQFSKLEKEFSSTLSNCFQNPELSDVLCFVVDQGSLFKTMPSSLCWGISKFDATIDDVALSQDYGHSTKAWALPKRIFNILKGSEIVRFSLGDSGWCEAVSDDVIVRYKPYTPKLSQFKAFRSKELPEEKINISVFEPIKELIKAIVKNSSSESEDFEISIELKENKIIATIDGAKFEMPTSYVGSSKKFGFNIAALNYILSYSDNLTLSECDSESVCFSDEITSIFLRNSGNC